MGVGLEGDCESLIWEPLFDGLDGGLDFVWVVAVIVDDCDAILFASDFLAAGGAVKGGEAFVDVGF